MTAFVRRLIQFTLAMLAVLFPAPQGALHAAEESRDKPNIIFVLTDDFGYGDLGSYGGAFVPTPDWSIWSGDESSIPTTCANGAVNVPPITARPNVTVFEPGFGAPRAWRKWPSPTTAPFGA